MEILFHQLDPFSSVLSGIPPCMHPGPPLSPTSIAADRKEVIALLFPCAFPPPDIGAIHVAAIHKGQGGLHCVLVIKFFNPLSDSPPKGTGEGSARGP